ncbi:hemerythrin domain-containing protein [Couchioplanes caeruleus]|uniref:hemerythrin domain-containing protein n=1 Tax=Couchioplanes caeruleus TaxID=56438 RepID=UPI0020C0F70E|nr:hemerythrin domain-containing protein [Couchioplanes caeruleus]UQU67169.1 hemerythrin domain-containing protein [Couchioplanes caeruleus]
MTHAASDEYARFTAYGHQLIAVHHRLLGHLDDLRDGSVPDRELAVHCRTLCSAVTRHHTGEDETVFPVLAARHPQLRSFLAELDRDHRIIAGLLTRLTALSGRLGAAPTEAGRDELRMELDGLAAVLETHFIGEEKRLVEVLNAVDPSVGLTGLDEPVR